MKYFFVFLLTICLPSYVFAENKAVVDITTMDIEDLREALDKGYLTSELLVQLYLDRISTYDDEFNSINQINDNALKEAKNLDEERSHGNIRGALHGIPLLVKTNIDVTNLATTAGTTALKDNYPNEDAEVIKKLKEAGAIILGSTNMSQFAFSATESLSSYGNVKNAYNLAYTPTGSSGGSAVAVALSFAAASLGTDTNTSVRLPASAAGLVGIRPTFDLVSTKGVIPYDVERDTVGVLSKTVKDNAIILEIISEESESNKYFKDDSFDLKNIKIGVIDSYVYGDSNKVSINSKTNEDIANLVDDKIKLLEENGAEIVHIDELIDDNYRSIANSTMTGSSFCDGFNEYIKNTTGKIRNFNQLASSYGNIYSLSGYVSNCNGVWKRTLDSKNSKKQTFEDHVKGLMEENAVDVILYPSAKLKLFKLSDGGQLNSPGSALGSVIGYPSITVPMGMIEGLPYGLEFFSYKYNEELLYNVASTFESLNENAVTTSPLAPSLYEIPGYLNELLNYYETYYNDNYFKEITHSTRIYFTNYNDTDVTTNETLANEIMDNYEKLKISYDEEKEEEKKRSNLIKIVGFTALAVLLLVAFVSLSKKKNKKRHKKRR